MTDKDFEECRNIIGSLTDERDCLKNENACLKKEHESISKKVNELESEIKDFRMPTERISDRVERERRISFLEGKVEAYENILTKRKLPLFAAE